MSPASRRILQTLAIVLRKIQRFGQEVHRLALRRSSRPALEDTDSADAHLRALRKFFLREARR
jgi:hypothetical protein